MLVHHSVFSSAGAIDVVIDIAIVVAAYLIGAIPTGLLVGKIGYGVDIRNQGSGNIGSTNAQRVLGDRAGYTVLVLDICKGLAVTLGAAWVAVDAFRLPPQPDPSASLIIVAAAAAAIIGNVFPIYIGFKGGKGMGVGTGVLLAMVPLIVLVLVVVWLVVRAATRYVSVASLLVALLFPVLMWWRHPNNLPYLVFSIFAAVLVVYSHRGNVKRLLAGNEARIRSQPRARSEQTDDPKEHGRDR